MTVDTRATNRELARIASAINPSTLLKVPENQQEMINQAVAVVLEPSFIEQADKEVGSPLEGESCDEFVARAEKVVIERLTKLIG
jgi:hypothetical protein